MAIQPSSANVVSKIYQDFIFNTLALDDVLRLPHKDISTLNFTSEGAVVYDASDGLAYMSSEFGAWYPILSASSDVGARSVAITAQGFTFTSTTSGVAFLPTATVTQQTNINTAVTANAVTGRITTVSASTAANDADIFTVNNSFLITGNERVQATVTNYTGIFGAGNNGLPVVSVDNVQVGSFDVVIVNASSVDALSGTLDITFSVWGTL